MHTTFTARQDKIYGSGEMATLTRERDWSAHPLGPIEGWSESLLCSVNMMLASSFPSNLFWGPEMTQFYNDAYLPLMAEKSPRALGQRAEDCWPEAWHIVGPQFRRVMEDGETIYQQDVVVPVVRHGDLQEIHWTYSYSPIYNADGTVGGIYVVCQDITKEVETTRRLGESEARANRILQSIGEAVIVTDAEMRVARMNPVAEELTGWTLAAAEGRLLTEVFDIRDAQTREKLESPAERVRRWGIGAGLNKHTLLYGRDGQQRYIDDSAAPVFESEEAGERKLTGMVLVFRDITERKRAESALIQSEKLAAVGRLAASIAHEINNPLESVTNLLYLAANSSAVPEIRGYIDVAERELKRAAAVTSQTLRFYRQSSGPREVEVEELVDGVLAVHQGRLLNSGVKLERRKRPSLPLRCFDGEIRQILLNLVGNAIDAMHPNGGLLLLRSRSAIRCATAERGLRFTVVDTGPGMNAETLARMFEPFYTTKGFGGTGLGLWVSHEIVERHHGAIRVRSSQQKGRSGTVFTVFLPYDAGKELR